MTLNLKDHHDKNLGLDVFFRERGSALVETPEFVKKRLGNYCIEAGFKCDMCCEYCSTGSTYHTQRVFTKIGHTSFDEGIAILDPKVPDKLADEVGVLTEKDTVIVSSKTDAWSQKAREYNIGHAVVKTLLEKSPATVRVLSKSSHTRDEFDLIEAHRERVLFGVSITGLPEHDDIVQLYERNACPVSKRIETMRLAAKRGLRTYAMFCPMFPGLFSSKDALRRLMDIAVECKVEGIWSEIVNPRGPGVQRCAQRLRDAGHEVLASAYDSMRRDDSRSQYGIWLTRNLQELCREYRMIDKLHVLSYASSYTDEAIGIINRDPEGVIWL